MSVIYAISLSREFSVEENVSGLIDEYILGAWEDKVPKELPIFIIRGVEDQVNKSGKWLTPLLDRYKKLGIKNKLGNDVPHLKIALVSRGWYEHPRQDSDQGGWSRSVDNFYS